MKLKDLNHRLVLLCQQLLLSKSWSTSLLRKLVKADDFIEAGGQVKEFNTATTCNEAEVCYAPAGNQMEHRHKAVSATVEAARSPVVHGNLQATSSRVKDLNDAAAKAQAIIVPDGEIKDADGLLSTPISVQVGRNSKHKSVMQVVPHSKKLPTDDELIKQMDWHDTRGILARRQGNYLVEDDDMFEEEELDEETTTHNFSIVAREGDLSSMRRERRPLEPTRVQPMRTKKSKKSRK